MKNALVLFSLIILCLSSGYSQKLGHSAITPFGGSSNNNNHTLHYNSGETHTSTSFLSELSLFDGLLNNISNDQFAEYYIQVKFYFDKNENGIKDEDETYMRIGSFSVNGAEIFSNYSEQGVILRADPEDYTIEYSSIGSGDWELTGQDSYAFSLGPNNKSETIEFGLYRDPVSEISIKMVSDPFRCFFPVDYRICVMNYGTVPEMGTVWVQMDSRFENIWYQQEPDHMIDSTFVGWDMLIQPNELIVYRYGITAPEVTDPEQLGTLYYTSVNVETDFGTTTEDLIQELTCSYDPNDKLVNPDRPDSLALLDIPITYTIRFQNTGNAEAYDVEVRDTLSEDLDMNTFRFIDSSHPDVLSIVFDEDDNHIVSFQFDNIFLPDSTTNLEGSNGFVMYQISVKEDTPINTEINNTGHIYFDFNPPIVTNTTSTTMVDTFPIISALETLEYVEDILIYPNPTKGIVYFEKEVDRVNVYDIYGRNVVSSLNVKSMDLKKYNSGTYLIELYLGETKLIKKLIITD